MKKFFSAIFILSVLLLPALAKSKSKSIEKVPAWFEHKEVVYPSEIYVSAVGEGDSDAEAKISAVSQIALFFNTSAEVYNDLLKEYNEIESDKNYSNVEKTEITEMATIRSSAEFFGVQFSDCLSVKNRVYVCAFINREEAFKVYDSEIKQNTAVVQSLLKSAQNDANPVRAAKNAEKGVKIAEVMNELVKNARLLKSVSETYFSKAENLYEQAQKVLDSCRDRKVFSLVVENDWNNSIYSCLSKLLESEGLSVSGKLENQSVLTVVISTDESEKSAGFFLTCSLSIKASSDGKSYFSYSRAFDKKGARTKNDAYRLTYKMIVGELEKSFLAEFKASSDEE